LEPTPASWPQFPELANEGAAVDVEVDDVEDEVDAGAVVDAGAAADGVDELLELPQPARSATAANVAETVPTFMEIAFRPSSERTDWPDRRRDSGSRIASPGDRASLRSTPVRLRW